MKYVNVVIILLMLGVLLGCSQLKGSVTGFAVVDTFEYVQFDYQQFLEDNKGLSETELFKKSLKEMQEFYDAQEEAEEDDYEEQPITNLGFQASSDPFRIAATHYNDSCFIASNLPGIGAGDVIYLTADVYQNLAADCIVLDVASITLDCNNSQVIGNVIGADEGIVISANNVTVQNCVVRNFTGGDSGSNGIYITNAGNVETELYNVTLYDIERAGVYVNAPGTLIADNIEIYRTSYYGFYFYRNSGTAINTTITNSEIYNITGETFSSAIRTRASGPFMFDNLTVHDCVFGIYLGESSFNTIGPYTLQNSHFYNNTGYNNHYRTRYDTTSGEHYIINNTFESDLVSPVNSVYIFGDSLSHLENITIKNNVFDYSSNISLATDIMIYYSDNVLLQNNSVRRQANMQYVNNVTISENRFIDIDPTISQNLVFFSGNDFDFQRNTVSKNIELYSITNLTVNNNTFEDSGNLISTLSTNVVISNNTFDNIGMSNGRKAGVYLELSDMTFTLNKLLNGMTYSFEINGDDNNITHNYVANTTGNAFKIRGNRNYLYNNTIYNHTGTVFWLRGDGDVNTGYFTAFNNTFYDNNITFVIKIVNTSLNFDNESGPYPQLPEGGIGFALINDTGTNITGNHINALNPNNYTFGIYGIKTYNSTIYDSSTLYTRDLWVYDNYFATTSNDTGLKTALFLYNVIEATVISNTIYNSEYEAIRIHNGWGNNISGNFIETNYLTEPYYSGIGVKLYRTTNNTIQDNDIINHGTGIYCLNSTFDDYLGNQINYSYKQGIFLMRCLNETLISNNVFNATAGIKLFFTNFSTLDTNVVNHTIIGFDFNQAHNNTISGVNVQDNSVVGVNLDLFSSGNVFNANVFGGNSDVDILYDMFATANSGAGNTFTTTRSENYATGNTIG